MQVIGIIAEYNPFHRGHRWQLNELRRRFPHTDGIVIVMSGSITQRGMPCILDKWTRAVHAIQGGADLVIELPFVFACRSAQDFARGGISLLSKLGIITRLAFGMEAENLAHLSAIAAQIDTNEIQRQIGVHIGKGASYSTALTHALIKKDISEPILRAPNNILAIEYLRALHRYAPKIAPIAIQRTAVGHSDETLHMGITSASSIRAELGTPAPLWENLQKSVMPTVFRDLRSAYRKGLPSEDALLPLIRYAFLTLDAAALQDIYSVTEGIENRMRQMLHTAVRYDDFLTTMATKRYTRSRIARLSTYLLIQLQKEYVAHFDSCGSAYIRPLAFNVRGRDLLRQMKGTAQLPIINRVAKFLTTDQRSMKMSDLSVLQQMLSFDTRATELRLLTLPTRTPLSYRTDFVVSPHFSSE